MIDAKGGAVVPGFNDAHAHLISGGLSLDQISLADAKTLDDIKDTIRVWSEAHPEREWITGRGWYYQAFGGAMPTRQLLDSLVPDRPAYLIAYDGHTGWANTRALKAAGITRTTKNPANGIIVRDPRTGQPTGALKEAAMALMSKAAPQPTEEDRLAAIRAAIDEAHRLGITSVQDAGGSAGDLELFDLLRKRNELSLRVYQALEADATLTEAGLEQLEQVRTRFADDPVLKAGAIKLFADGVIESHTAAMLAPYANRPSIKGEARFTPEQLTRVVGMLDGRGWQIMTHAIGDAAVRMTLDAYEAAAKTNAAPERGRRHRIEHIETIDPEDIPRFGRLGVVASMQPVHATPSPTPGDVWSTNIGEERASHGWLWASIAKSQGPDRVWQRLAGHDLRSESGAARRRHAGTVRRSLQLRRTGRRIASDLRITAENVCRFARPFRPTRATAPGLPSTSSARAPWPATCSRTSWYCPKTFFRDCQPACSRPK